MPYEKKARRMGYIRWRIRRAKDVTDIDLTELLDYAAVVNPSDRKVLESLSNTSIDELRKMTVDELRVMAINLGILPQKIGVTKKDLLDCISGFKAAGYTNR